MEDALNFSANAMVVLRKRYLKKDNQGKVAETPRQLIERVAKTITGIEAIYGADAQKQKEVEDAFFAMMGNLEFMPNSPTLMNAGRELGQLSACFVVPVEDSMESIFDAIKSTALIHKTGGGTGFSFSRLRPKNSVVKSTGGVASGPVSFMKVFDSATQAVKQGGTRRGANMGILRVDHPDILEFIKCKEKEGQISNFNISVALTDEFMDKVLKKEEYSLIDPYTKEMVGKLDASEVFNLIATYAHKNGEPGIVFIDRINRDNPTTHLGLIESTNPCVAGDTLVPTEKGLLRIKDIAEKCPQGGLRILVDEAVLDLQYRVDSNLSVEVKRECSLQTISRAFKSGLKECFRITTDSGFELTATPDHKIMTTRGWVPLENLKINEDEVLIQPQEAKFNPNLHLPFEKRNAYKGGNGRLYKMNLPENWSKVVKKEYVGRKDVYDLTEPFTHSFIANGIVISNCGEQPLLPFESCNLGSINLAKMLKKTESGFEVDWDKLKEVTQLAVRFLDNVIDANKFPLEKIKENTQQTRKIGLGVMGWASMLGFLGIPYDSDEAIGLARELMRFIWDAARNQSAQLAQERGVFAAWKGSLWQKKGIKIRNATLTTIAPTGTISIIAGPTSSGVEPNFSLCYFRNVLDGERLLEVDPAFEYAAKRDNFYSEELMQKIAKGENLQNMEGVPEKIKRIFKTAMDISPFWHLKTQAAFQEFTDNAVSKTINLPNSATVDDVKEAYLLAYKLGCKGVTVYRDGSRITQVLTTDKAGKKKDVKEPQGYSLAVPYPKPRPEVILGTTTKVTTGCGNLYITVNQDEENNLFEVFTQMGKAGGCAASQLEAVGRLVSLALRGGIDIKVIVEQLKGIRCPSPSWDKGKKIFSCADAIARVLEKRGIDQEEIANVTALPAKLEQKENKIVAQAKSVGINIGSHNVVGVCLECGYALRHQEGCLVCDACGYSKC